MTGTSIHSMWGVGGVAESWLSEVTSVLAQGGLLPAPVSKSLAKRDSCQDPHTPQSQGRDSCHSRRAVATETTAISGHCAPTISSQPQKTASENAGGQLRETLAEGLGVKLQDALSVFSQ